MPQAQRLRLAVLVHLPLAEETGLDPEVAAELDARERATLHAAHAVVATGGACARHLVHHHELPPGKVHVVEPGVDPAPLARGTDGISHLLCVASLTPRKGQDLLVEALATVEGPWRCTFAGPLKHAEYVARLRESLRDKGFQDRCELPGPVTGRALDDAYDSADLVVLPSRAETYGMVVTEALARGVPVLATEVADIAETLAGAGIVVPPGNAGALADGLRSWFGDAERRRSLRAAARVRRGMLAPWTETSRRMAAVLDRL